MSSPIHTDYTKKNQSDDKVAVKKSTFHTLLAGFVVAIAIATFLGGYAVGTFDDDSDSTITVEQLQEILSNRDRALKMGKAGRATAEEQFSWDKTAEDFMTLFNNHVVR